MSDPTPHRPDAEEPESSVPPPAPEPEPQTERT
jgi:hypothetical protein